jgi:hypothetical protein
MCLEEEVAIASSIHATFARLRCTFVPIGVRNASHQRVIRRLANLVEESELWSIFNYGADAL